MGHLVSPSQCVYHLSYDGQDPVRPRGRGVRGESENEDLSL